MATEALSLKPRREEASVSGGGRACGEFPRGEPSATAPWTPDVDRWCDSLLSLLIGGIGVLSLALFAALGTFHH